MSSPGKWLRTAVVLCVPLGPLVIAARSYRAEKGIFFPPRHPVPVTAAAAGIPGLVDVELASAGTRVRGWYAPSTNRAAVLLLHGAGADRSQLLPEARTLAQHGFGVMLIDLPGHGSSDGEIHWSAGERAAVIAAVDWLSARADVDPARLGAYGFSMGCYVLTSAAAADPRLRAVVLAGTPSDVFRQSRWQFQRWSFLSWLPARWALERGGIDRDSAQPRTLVASISPRPVLVIAASQDPVVPLDLTRELEAAAREPKELYLLEGAQHGNYGDLAPVAYPQRLVDFFRRALRV